MIIVILFLLYFVGYYEGIDDQVSYYAIASSHWLYIGTSTGQIKRIEFPYSIRKIFGFLQILSGMSVFGLMREHLDIKPESLVEFYGLTQIFFGIIFAKTPTSKNEMEWNGHSLNNPVIVRSKIQLDLMVDTFAKEKKLASQYLGTFGNDVIGYQFIEEQFGGQLIVRYFKIDNSIKAETNKNIEKIKKDRPVFERAFLKYEKMNLKKIGSSIINKSVAIGKSMKTKVNEILSKDELDKEIIRARKELELKKIRKEMEDLDN